MSSTLRILALAAREPQLDPRFGWVNRVCSEVAHTDFLAAVWAPVKAPEREYDGRVYLERVNVLALATTSAKMLGGGLGSLLTFGPVARDVKRVTRLDPSVNGSRARTVIDRRIGVTGRLLASYGQQRMVMSALLERSRALSLPPAVVICHDLPTLPVGLALRREVGARVVFDCHDFWPHLNPVADDWERSLVERFERRLIHRADAVVTVSPPLARHIERVYGLKRVVVSPNAEPFRGDAEPALSRRSALPVRFLFQGGAAPGRGVDVLLETWTRLNDPRAVLRIQCPANPYLDDLKVRFADAIARGRIVMLPPVRAESLVPAASFADVGVIPYFGQSVNHRYACPNKLSQYMNAGLAVLSHELDFVSEVVSRYDCGTTYDATVPATLAAAVDQLVSDLSRLDQLRENAFRASREEFNWDVQSRDYRRLLDELSELPR